MQRYKKR